MEWQKNQQSTEKDLLPNPYSSVDPAPPAATADIDVLRQRLLDEELPLFQRYRAMFTLRNIGTKDAVLALADGKDFLKIMLNFKKKNQMTIIIH
jgi:deoxyhypusine monooxygenase